MPLFLKPLKSVFWPERCIFCGSLVSYNDNNVCGRCRDSLPYIRGKVCVCCGCEKPYCSCTGRIMYYDRFTAPFYYEKEVKKSLRSFKFFGRDNYAAVFASFIAGNIRLRYADENFDYIACVPLYGKDRRKRGYNQSELLARELSELLGIPFRKDIIKKIYPTEKQSSHGLIGRSGNVLGAFDVTENTEGSSVLLIDDIRTTGSTLSECGKMLYLKGAKRVCCAAVAAGRKKRK